MSLRSNGNITINADAPTNHATSNQGVWFGTDVGSFARGSLLDTVIGGTFNGTAFVRSAGSNPMWYHQTEASTAATDGYQLHHVDSGNNTDYWTFVAQDGADNRGAFYFGVTQLSGQTTEPPDPPAAPFNQPRVYIKGSQAGDAVDNIDGLVISVFNDNDAATPLFVEATHSGGGTTGARVARFRNANFKTQLEFGVATGANYPFDLSCFDENGNTETLHLITQDWLFVSTANPTSSHNIEGGWRMNNHYVMGVDTADSNLIKVFDITGVAPNETPGTEQKAISNTSIEGSGAGGFLATDNTGQNSGLAYTFTNAAPFTLTDTAATITFGTGTGANQELFLIGTGTTTFDALIRLKNSDAATKTLTLSADTLGTSLTSDGTFTFNGGTNALLFNSTGTIQIGNATLGGTVNIPNVIVFNFNMADGTAPFTVDSTTVVTNLNADTVDAIQGAEILQRDGSIPLTGDWDAGGFDVKFEDSKGLVFGTSDDDTIEHDGTDLLITPANSVKVAGSETITGNLVVNTRAAIGSNAVLGASTLTIQDSFTGLGKTTGIQEVMSIEPSATKTGDTFGEEIRVFFGPGTGNRTFSGRSTCIFGDFDINRAHTFTGTQACFLTDFRCRNASATVNEANNFLSDTPSAVLGTFTQAMGFHHKPWGSNVTTPWAVFVDAGSDPSFFGEDVRIDSDKQLVFDGASGDTRMVYDSGAATLDCFVDNVEVWNASTSLVSVAQDIDFAEGQSVDVETVTATSATLGDDDYVILADDDTAGAQITITLPAAASHTGRVYFVKKLGTTANIVVDGNASETIDGNTTHTLSAQFEAINIVCDGSNWHII